MHTFPDVVITGPDYSIWLWLLVPVVLFVLAWVLEHVIENYTEKKRGKPLIGIGYTLMGAALFIIPISAPLIIDYQEDLQTQKAITALESIGFDEVRLSGSSGAFGGYYGDELLRGALVPDQYHQDVYFVIQTPRPTDN